MVARILFTSLLLLSACQQSATEIAAAKDESYKPSETSKPKPSYEFVETNAPSQGMNLASVVDWSTQLPFIDLMKQARGWKDWSNKTLDLPIDVDQNDWVRRLESEQTAGTVFLTAPGEPIYGTYHVFYEGKGKVLYKWSAKKIKTVEEGKHDIIRVGKGSSLLEIAETNALDPIKNIRIIAEEHLAAYQRGEIFNPDFIEKISQFRALRYMDWLGTNGSMPYLWIDRPKMEHRSWRGRGVPLELIAKLSNETRTIPWINIPHWADHDTIRQFAAVFKVELSQDLPIYVEHSNEVWNWGFKQSHYAKREAEKIWGKKGDGFLQWHGMRTAQVCDIFKLEVFLQDQHRVFCALGVQTGWQGAEKSSIECGLWEQSPCFKHGIDVLAITTYFDGGLNGTRKGKESENSKRLLSLTGSADGVTQAASILQNGDKTVFGKKPPFPGVKKATQQSLQYWFPVAQKYGLRLAAYEGGQHITSNGKALQDDKSVMAFHGNLNRAPEFSAIYHDLFDVWKTSGGELHMHFNDIQSYGRFGSWGALESVNQETSPKWQAITSFNRESPCWWQSCKDFPVSKEKGSVTPLQQSDKNPNATTE